MDQRADLERQIRHLDLVPPAERQKELKNILKAIYEYLRNHPWQTACIFLAAGAVIGGFLVTAGLLTGGAATAGPVAAGASSTVELQAATIGPVTVAFVVGILTQTISK